MTTAIPPTIKIAGLLADIMTKNRFGKKCSVKTRTVALLLTMLVAISACLPVPAYADVEGWEGWTEDNIEDAWSVYVTTSWNDVASLTFSVSESGSIASANVPDDFRTNYESTIRDILSDYPYALQFKSSTNNRDHSEYTELILAIAYRLYNWGLSEGTQIVSGVAFNEYDVCFLSWFIDQDYAEEFDSVEDCFSALIWRYYLSERYFLINHPVEGENYSIYSNDDYLGAVIQGVIYGFNYTKENTQYTANNASEYFSAHADEINERPARTYSTFSDLSRFAAQVGNSYSAIRSLADDFVVG